MKMLKVMSAGYVPEFEQTDRNGDSIGVAMAVVERS